MSESNFQERRQYKRIEKHFILSYYATDHPEHRFAATQIKNISGGGMCLITEQTFTPGTILELEVKSAFFSNITRLQGEVLQSHERVKNIIYETRIQFKNISPEAEAVIKKSITFFENNESIYD